jgi:GT2 family glycosyltransferase
MRDVLIVVVNWNNAVDTIACLESIEAYAGMRARTVVVDNGSTDASTERLEAWIGKDRRRESFAIVRTQTNEGFAGGVNAGVSAAGIEDVDYVLLINSDAQLQSGTLDELVAVARESGAGLVGARIADSRTGEILFEQRRWPLRLFGAGSGKGTGERFWSSDDVDGAAMMIRRDVIEERMRESGNLLDPGLFLYWEDVDVCRWSITRGYGCVVARDAIVPHKVAASSGGMLNARSYYYGTRNRVAVANRWLSSPMRVVFHLWYAPSRLAIALFRMVRRPQAARAILTGLADGYRGVKGGRRIERLRS